MEEVKVEVKVEAKVEDTATNSDSYKNKVWVFGYYDKQNFGDECFKHVFQHYLSDMNHPLHKNNRVEYEFFNPEQPYPLPVPTDVRCIFIGGGDIINEYFFNKLRPIFNARPCPIYAVGVGFPYPKLIEEGYVDQLDYVVHRTESCHERVTKAIGPNRVHFTPDLAWLMSTDIPLEAGAALKKNFLGCLCQPKRVKPNTKRIAVCLARPMRNKDNEKHYYDIVEGIGTFLYNLAKQKVFTSEKRTLYGTEEILVSPPSVDEEDGQKHLSNGKAKDKDEGKGKDEATGNEHGKSAVASRQLSDTDKKKRKKKKPKNKRYVFHIDFIPFGTSKSSENENDCIMQQDVLYVMQRLNQNNVFGNVSLYSDSPEEPVSFFRNYDYAVCSRFHAHIFALSAGVPVISVSCTNKVNDLMVQAGLEEYTYTLPVHPEKFFPIDCDHKEIEDRFLKMRERETDVRRSIHRFGDRMRGDILMTSRIIRNLIYYLPKPITRYQQTRPAEYVANFVSKLVENDKKLVEKDKGDGEKKDINTLSTIYLPGGLKKVGLSEKHLDRVVRLLSLLIVGKPFSPYNYGLREQLLSDTYNLRESCKWIHNHFVKESPDESNEFPNEKKYYTDMHVVNCEIPKSQDKPFYSPQNQLTCHSFVDFETIRGPLSIVGGKKENVHRSGWDYVCYNLFSYQDPCAEIAFDSYLDETFGWRYEVLRDAGRIPYTRPWMGILHHTPEEQFSENNLVKQFKRAAWRESLKHCRGLVTLSDHLAKWVRVQLVQLGFHHVEVHHLKHPTQFPSLEKDFFSMENLETCVPKKVVQIGGWLRNTYAIFELPMVIHRGFRKCALKGKGMDHYYLSHEQFDQFERDVERAWDNHVLQKHDHDNGHSHNHGHGHITGDCSTPPHKKYAPLASLRGQRKHGNKTGNLESPESYNVVDSLTDESVEDDDNFSAVSSCLVDSDRYTPFGKSNSHKKPVGKPDVPLNILQHISPYIMGARQNALEGLRRRHQSVTMLDFVSNEAYDALLSESVVFINLVDASACNTVLECIARHTPILINPLPAVVEYLGVDYPLYYTDFDEAAFMLTKRSKLEEAHEYLKQLDVTDLKVESFAENFNRVIGGDYEEPRQQPRSDNTFASVATGDCLPNETTTAPLKSKNKKKKQNKKKGQRSPDMIDFWVKSIDEKLRRKK
jgi:exopolysaccharide biosynthesis predicted pyruvyltransferase EpsI